MMKRNLFLTATFLFLIISGCHFPVKETAESKTSEAFPAGCWGVYNYWVNDWNVNSNIRESCPLIKGVGITIRWKDVEPEPGVFKFDELIGEKLKLVDAGNMYTWLMIWVAPSAPRWLYENGVPEVQMYKSVTPLGEPRDWSYQYYLNEDYIRFHHRLLNEFGQYIRSLPLNLQKRILFVQSAEGSTGDGQPYKSTPIDTKYNISDEQWGDFRIKAWEVLKKALSNEKGEMVKPMLVNYDANGEEEYNWVKNNLSVIGLKNGMFSHGYQISDTRQRIKNWNNFKTEVNSLGKEFFSRGEQDGEWAVYGWSTQNREQGLYWSAIFATHCGLDMWNLPSEACIGYHYQDAINFFNKYAGQFDPASASAAFCALSKGLDAMDTVSYPENQFGAAKRSNIDRYLKIMEAFKDHGAMQGDPQKAIGSGMVNRKANDYNDVGWGIADGNFCRFLTQIDPEGTSTGWWHVGPRESIYGRFARSFDVKNKKNSMYFDLDDHFLSATGKAEIKVKIIWLDKGYGEWSLLYDAKNKPGKTALTVKNSDTGKWVEKSIMINDALLQNSCEKGADFILKNLSEENTIFHIIEIEKSN
ncbi:MAG: hypothetical protein NT144_14015 [Bacteroidia bacterium]|nr:hypothetical protein [Bacteroidia bacterium]